MKKTIILITLLFLVLPVFSVSAIDWIGSAERDSVGGVVEDIASKSGYDTGAVDTNSLAYIVANFLKFFFATLGVIFLVIVIYAGFKWMTAGGNEEQVTSARKLLINAAIGLAIIVLAYSITHFVSSAISYSTVNQPNYPN